MEDKLRTMGLWHGNITDCCEGTRIRHWHVRRLSYRMLTITPRTMMLLRTTRKLPNLSTRSATVQRMPFLKIDRKASIPTRTAAVQRPMVLSLRTDRETPDFPTRAAKALTTALPLQRRRREQMREQMNWRTRIWSLTMSMMK